MTEKGSVDMLMNGEPVVLELREEMGREDRKGFFVLRSWRRCVFGYEDFVDRICPEC